MNSNQIKCYRPGQLLTGINFFVLTRGNNSGKPGRSPWTNSFIINCKSDEERERLYYLCFALWITGKFRPLLVGSCVELIRKHDFWQTVELADCRTLQYSERFTSCVTQLITNDERIKTIHRNLRTHQILQYETLRCLLA
jgi:hypothetical protein